jgi:hypothetical protein
MPPTVLEQAIAEGGIRSVNFFNGRLLTGQDLSREQAARRLADQRAAQAAGQGIAWGLDVSQGPSTTEGGASVTVQPGLAVSASGRTLWLDAPITVALGRRAPPRAKVSRTFDTCKALGSGTYAAGPGVYLLTLAPAEDHEGRAQVLSLDDALTPCNTDTLVEAVRFRLLALDKLVLDERDAVAQRTPTPAASASLNLLRNRIAHRCLGTDAQAGFLANPLGSTAAPYGLLSGIAGQTLSECDVPLAIIKLDTGVDFIDQWSVRRRITRPGAGAAWTMLTDDRRLAEGEAAFMQFQEQLSQQATAATLVAREHFDFLPAAGILPLDGGDATALARFFDGLTVRGPAYIEGARLDSLLRASFAYPPIDLRSGELIWLYRVRQNQQSIDQKLSPIPQPCIVFASGHMPYQADARFGVSRWDYANTAIDG